MANPGDFQQRTTVTTAVAAGVAYIITAGLWITFSDTLLLLIVPTADVETLSSLQTLKGWGFVLVTGILFSVVLYRKLGEISRSNCELQIHMESYRILFERHPHPMWIYDTTTLRFIAVNDAAVHNYGYSREEFLGMTVCDIRPAEDVAEFLHVLRRGDYVMEGVWRHLWKNGSVRYVQVTSNTMPFLGKQVRVSLAHDITESHRATEELRRSEQKFRRVLENSHDVIYELNLDSRRYDYVSPSSQRVLALSPDDLVRNGTRLLMERIHEDDRPASVAHLRTLLHAPDGEDASIEYRVRLDDSTERWVRDTRAVVRDDTGRQCAIVGTIRDITVRKHAEEAVRRLNEELERRVEERTVQLEATNRELEAFSYSVSHDLRAPLRSIGGFSRILLEDYSDRLDDRGRDYLRRVQAASTRMGQLIDDLLTLSRVTRADLRHSTVDISALATAVVDALRSAHPERRVRFHCQPGISVRADTNLMRVVLENLIDNAWKFTAGREEARIEVGMTTADEPAVYYVRDNGVGFDMQYADKLFGAFQRLHSVREFEGTGIGLATVQRIINRHGGRVWAESVVDEGTTFYFTFPD